MNRVISPTSNKPVLHLLALAGSIAFAFVLAGCGSRAAEPAGGPPPADVSIAAVLSKNVRQWDDFTGRVAAVETVDLRPRVSGYIERVAYQEGQEVRKGDLLFVIDQRPYQAELAQAQAQLERARSDAALAKTQDARAQTLIAAKVISREEFETRHAATAERNAVVRGAEAAVATARLNLQFTEVRSPISGRAGRALVTTGNLAQADTTLLTTLVSLDPVHVYFEGDEQSYLRYNQLAREGRRDASHNPVRVGLANEIGYPHTGTVDFIDNQVDARTGTIRARAVLANPDHIFTPGLFARVQIEGSGEFKALLIDDKAVLTDQDRKYVYVVGPENTAQRKDVQLGRMVDGLRVVQSGLAPTDRVVVDGVQKIFFPGMPVKATVVAMSKPVGGGAANVAVANK
ncbi:MAG TPA: efflux RND transporter periplasmic adaptor subunit [Arenimonas sp.]|uniref:efflux RND transporter periplasmic adaptor subunit n=1 Tax=Arenimonas sp. TaxID=1872635 RepID=UPI002CEFD100|nr:efflux RND transporter periplasmic adaptor subunit [Arenimonas sp.]HMB56466.1 efflux RND transporter periplasmic adaptor subunit [Arenimonas sp.]